VLLFRLLVGVWPSFVVTTWTLFASVIGAIIGYAIICVPLGVGLGSLVYLYISEDNRKRVLDIHPLYGRGEHAIADMKMGEDVWATLTVVNTKGEEVPKDHLNEVEFVTSRDPDTGEVTAVTNGYEVMGYDAATNTATASYLGQSSLDFRRYEKMLERVEQELLTMSDWGVESLLDQPLVARMIAARVTRYLVECHAKATMPNGDEAIGMARDVLDELGQDKIESLEEKLQRDLPEGTPDPKNPGHSFDYGGDT